jgi:hypothetical protein
MIPGLCHRHNVNFLRVTHPEDRLGFAMAHRKTNNALH